MVKSPKTFTSHSPPRARKLSGPATRRRSTRELLQTRNRAFGPNGVPTTSRQTSAIRTDTTSRLPISLGSTNKRRRSVKKIVVIGTGRMGGAFATAFAERTSHTVSIRGSHKGSSSAAALSRQLGVRVADDKELLAADVVFVATPPAALDDVAAALKGYAGIIVSAMVPGAGGYELKRDDGTSAAEQLARLVPTGRVV